MAVFKYTINTNQPGNGPKHSLLPLVYFVLYNFLVTDPNLTEFGDFSQNLSGINIMDFFSKFQLVLVLLQCRHFFAARCYFLYMSSIGIVNISFAVLIAFESTESRKTYVDFSNNIFPIDTVIIDFGRLLYKFRYMGSLIYS